MHDLYVPNAVSSVNGYTGAVTLTASDVGAASSSALNNYVLKAGDTMTGRLASQAALLGFSQNRSGKELTFGVTSSADFQVYNGTNGYNIYSAYSDGTGLSIGPSGTQLRYGTGFPDGVVSAPVGSIYIDTAVTNGASSWIKKSGTGNTGWQVLEGDTGWRNCISLYVEDWRPPAKTVNRFLGIRRVNNMVYIQGSTARQVEPPLAANARISLFTIPSGFTVPQTYFVPGVAWQGTYGTIGRVGTGLGGSQEYDVVFSSYTGAASWTTATILTFQSTYATLAPWPSTLPGTA